MKNRYGEIMDRIEVTDEMRSRILRNLQQIDSEPESRQKAIPFSSVKKYLSLAACAAVLLFSALALSGVYHGAAFQGQETVFQGSGITEFSSAEELSDALRFEVSDITGLPFKVMERTYTSYWGELAEICYIGAERTAVFRKSPGDGDNSGDYTEYPVTQAFTVGTIPVTLKGTSDKFTLAIWQDGTYCYSLSIRDGLTLTQWESLFREMN